MRRLFFILALATYFVAGGQSDSIDEQLDNIDKNVDKIDGNVNKGLNSISNIKDITEKIKKKLGLIGNGGGKQNQQQMVNTQAIMNAEQQKANQQYQQQMKNTQDNMNAKQKEDNEYNLKQMIKKQNDRNEEQRKANQQNLQEMIKNQEIMNAKQQKANEYNQQQMEKTLKKQQKNNAHAEPMVHGDMYRMEFENLVKHAGLIADGAEVKPDLKDIFLSMVGEKGDGDNRNVDFQKVAANFLARVKAVKDADGDYYSGNYDDYKQLMQEGYRGGNGGAGNGGNRGAGGAGNRGAGGAGNGAIGACNRGAGGAGNGAVGAGNRGAVGAGNGAIGACNGGAGGAGGNGGPPTPIPLQQNGDDQQKLDQMAHTQKKINDNHEKTNTADQKKMQQTLKDMNVKQQKKNTADQQKSLQSLQEQGRLQDYINKNYIDPNYLKFRKGDALYPQVQKGLEIQLKYAKEVEEYQAKMAKIIQDQAQMQNGIVQTNNKIPTAPSKVFGNKLKPFGGNGAGASGGKGGVGGGSNGGGGGRVQNPPEKCNRNGSEGNRSGAGASGAPGC
jgi:hypothetical protein